MKPVVRASLLAALLALTARAAMASELAGSPASMVHQHAVAVEEDYSFLRTPADVRHMVDAGKLVPVKPAADYHAATGSRLVVTSLTRPLDKQPANAHALSVHPAGMAVDLRVPADADDR